MFQLALPVITGLLELFKHKKLKGVDEQTMGSVVNALDDFIHKDERAQAFLAKEMEKARQHDIATFDKTDLFSNRLRSSVRPLVTFSAMGWYIYARLNHIPLSPEDYAIIGGIMGFWFGFRPFEKRKK